MFTVYRGSSITSTDVNSCSAYTLPDLNLGQYRTAPGGGGIEVPARTVINATTTMVLYSWSKLYRQPAILLLQLT
jgi:hypothetical protein